MGSIPITRFGTASGDGSSPDASTNQKVYVPPLAAVAQLVERVLGKDEVLGPIPSSSFL